MGRVKEERSTPTKGGNLDVVAVKAMLGSLNHLKNTHAGTEQGEAAEEALSMYAAMSPDQKSSFLEDFASKAIGKGAKKDLTWVKSWSESATGFNNVKAESNEDFLTRFVY